MTVSLHEANRLQFPPPVELEEYVRQLSSGKEHLTGAEILLDSLRQSGGPYDLARIRDALANLGFEVSEAWVGGLLAVKVTDPREELIAEKGVPRDQFVVVNPVTQAQAAMLEHLHEPGEESFLYEAGSILFREQPQ